MPCIKDGFSGAFESVNGHQPLSLLIVSCIFTASLMAFCSVILWLCGRTLEQKAAVAQEPAIFADLRTKLLPEITHNKPENETPMWSISRAQGVTKTGAIIISIFCAFIIHLCFYSLNSKGITRQETMVMASAIALNIIFILITLLVVIADKDDSYPLQAFKHGFWLGRYQIFVPYTRIGRIIASKRLTWMTQSFYNYTARQDQKGFYYRVYIDVFAEEQKKHEVTRGNLAFFTDSASKGKDFFRLLVEVTHMTAIPGYTEEDYFAVNETRLLPIQTIEKIAAAAEPDLKEIGLPAPEIKLV